MYVLWSASALMIGGLLAVQASANQQLNKAVGNPYGASTLQLGVAAGALAALATATGAVSAVALVPEVEPWWLLLGGVASPLYITAGIVLFPRLGALTSVGLFVTGQVFASLALDLFGLLGVPRQPVGPGIVVGAIAVLVGIGVVVRAQLTSTTTPAVASQEARLGGPAPGPAHGTIVAPHPLRNPARSSWVGLGLLAGGVLPVQGAINAQLKNDVERPLAVATISFLVATLTIAAVLALLLALRATPSPRLSGLGELPWWGWLGGFCAATYVTVTFLLIPTIGAAVTIALTVTGQQLASALIDQFGYFRMSRRPLTAPRISGLVLLIAGSILVQIT